MTKVTYAKHERISLKGHPEFGEKWLQDRIVEDPSILGLGDVIVIDRERPQERAGRLDLLLADPEQNRRYEVELMLGSTDESHIIRCIEYWDIERRRYPGYEHCAVLIVTSIARGASLAAVAHLARRAWTRSGPGPVQTENPRHRGRQLHDGQAGPLAPRKLCYKAYAPRILETCGPLRSTRRLRAARTSHDSDQGGCR
jgi:hypothetical protein